MSALKNRISSVYYAILSRVRVIEISFQDLYFKSSNNNIFTQIPNYPIFVENSFSETDRVINLINKLNITLSIPLYIFLVPYSFYSTNLKRFVSGVGTHKFNGCKNLVAVAKYSFWKPELYPYLEHEILHAVGILKYDHSNSKRFKEYIKYEL